VNWEDFYNEIARYVHHRASLLCLVLDREGHILKANDYAEKLTGKSLEGLLFHGIAVRFASPPGVQELLASGTDSRLIHIETAAGLPQTLHFHFLPVGERVLALGEINGFEIEMLRKTLVTLNSELSVLGRELQKKNAELMQLNDHKNRFLGMAAHDLRNPISVIQTYSEFLLDEAGESLQDEHFEFLKVICKSSEFMLGLLNDLLDIAKIEAGKLELHRKQTDLASLIRTNLERNRVLAQKKDICIVFRHDEATPKVPVDSDKMHQVLNNLVSNAVKFSPPGSTVSVTTFKTAGWIAVSVRDQGPGISEEDRKLLFQPFARTSAKSTGGEKSTGLGLAIANRIVTGHGGRIRVEDAPGGGSTFIVSLPLDIPEGETTERV